MIGVGVNGHTGTVSVTSKLSYANGFLAVSDIVCVFFAPNFPRVIINLPLHIDLCIFWHVIAHLYPCFLSHGVLGHVVFFTFVSEMKRPQVRKTSTTIYFILNPISSSGFSEGPLPSSDMRHHVVSCRRGSCLCIHRGCYGLSSSW